MDAFTYLVAVLVMTVTVILIPASTIIIAAVEINREDHGAQWRPYRVVIGVLLSALFFAMARSMFYYWDWPQ